MRVPDMFYHRTGKENVGSIRSRGLMAEPDEAMFDDDTPGVNLVAHPDQVPWPARRGDVYVVIDPRSLERKKLVNLGSGWWRYRGDIPRSSIMFTKGAVT